MIKSEINGYVKFPETKKSGGGKVYNAFKLNTKTGKNKEGKAEYTQVRCMDFNGNTLPDEDSFVTVKGNLKPFSYEKDGKTVSGLELFVDSLETVEKEEPAAPKKGEVPQWLRDA